MNTTLILYYTLRIGAMSRTDVTVAQYLHRGLKRDIWSMSCRAPLPLRILAAAPPIKMLQTKYFKHINDDETIAIANNKCIDRWIGMDVDRYPVAR